jgi:hypothetical protein
MAMKVWRGNLGRLCAAAAFSLFRKNTAPRTPGEGTNSSDDQANRDLQSHRLRR